MARRPSASPLSRRATPTSTSRRLTGCREPRPRRPYLSCPLQEQADCPPSSSPRRHSPRRQPFSQITRLGQTFLGHAAILDERSDIDRIHQGRPLSTAKGELRAFQVPSSLLSADRFPATLDMDAARDREDAGTSPLRLERAFRRMIVAAHALDSGTALQSVLPDRQTEFSVVYSAGYRKRSRNLAPGLE